MVKVDKNLYYTPKVHVVVAHPTLESVNAWLEDGAYPENITYTEIRSSDLLIKLFEDEKQRRSVCYCITKKCFVLLASFDIEKVN